MSLLNKAKSKAKSTKTTVTKKKNTTWSVGGDNNEKVSKSVKELAKISAEMKALDAKKKIHANVVAGYAEGQFISDFCDLGVLPETPMKVVNSDGDSVTYVVQDRGGQYKLKDDQIEALKQILGEDGAEELLYTQHTISFNRSVMALPGVTEAIDEALTAAVEKMVEDGVLSEESADELVQVDEKIAFKPGTLERAAMLVGRNVTRLKDFLGAMGSSCCRYIKI